MRILRADAGRVWSGAAELFELYLLHTYATFADVGLMDVLGRGGATSRALGVVTLSPSVSLSCTLRHAFVCCGGVGVGGSAQYQPRRDAQRTLRSLL